MSNDKPVDGPETAAPHDETQPIGSGTPAAGGPPPETAPDTAAQPAQPVAPPVGPPMGPPVDQSTVPPVGPVAPKRRFVDRVWGFRSMVAVALAAVILGGLGGAAIAKASDGGDQRARFGPGMMHRGGPFAHLRGRRGFGPGQGRRGFGQGQGQGGFGQNGQGQPGVVPPTPSATTSPTTPSKNS